MFRQLIATTNGRYNSLQSGEHQEAPHWIAAVCLCVFVCLLGCITSCLVPQQFVMDCHNGALSHQNRHTSTSCICNPCYLQATPCIHRSQSRSRVLTEQQRQLQCFVCVSTQDEFSQNKPPKFTSHELLLITINPLSTIIVSQNKKCL